MHERNGTVPLRLGGGRVPFSPTQPHRTLWGIAWVQTHPTAVPEARGPWEGKNGVRH